MRAGILPALLKNYFFLYSDRVIKLCLFVNFGNHQLPDHPAFEDKV